MARPIALLMKDYDYLAPLACGDVTAEGLALKLTRDTPGALDRTLNDPSVQASELSFSRHVHRLAAGDRSFVGIPFFAYRAFRHRCFFIRRDDGPRDFADLAGKRIGTNEWPASGNTWSRALIREAGVKIEEIHWWVGSVDGAASKRPQGTLPPLCPGRTAGSVTAGHASRRRARRPNVPGFPQRGTTLRTAGSSGWCRTTKRPSASTFAGRGSIRCSTSSACGMMYSGGILGSRRVSMQRWSGRRLPGRKTGDSWPRRCRGRSRKSNSHRADGRGLEPQWG
jgi:hypothetical protein